MLIFFLFTTLDFVYFFSKVLSNLNFTCSASLKDVDFGKTIPLRLLSWEHNATMVTIKEKYQVTIVGMISGQHYIYENGTITLR